MALRDGKQYCESLRDGREVYIHGERVEDVTLHPILRKAIDHGTIDYELDKREGLRDLFVTRSPTTGYEIRRYFEIPRTAEDLLRRRELIETATKYGNAIILFMKEIGTDALNAFAMITHQL
jgi:4-hydroxyphenylacetate 3-monooxygenase